jgi:hypothetical protein
MTYYREPTYTSLNNIALLLLAGGLGLILVRSAKNYFCDYCSKQIRIGEEYAYRTIHHKRVKRRTCVERLNKGFSS